MDYIYDRHVIHIYVMLKNNGMKGSVIPCPLQIIGLKCVFECAYSHGRSYSKTRDNFFTLVLKYLLPAPWIHYLEHLKDFYGIRFFFNKIKVIQISLQRFHIIYNRQCEILHNINSRDSSDGRVIGYDPHG